MQYPNYFGWFSHYSWIELFQKLKRTVDKNQFLDQPNLLGITIPQAKDIGDGAFRDSPLTSLSLPEATKIGNQSFYNSRLTSLSLPDAWKIGTSAFENSPLTSLSLPKVEIIGSQAFSFSPLTSLSLPKVEEIGKDTFNIVNSPNTRVTLPKKLIHLRNWVEFLKDLLIRLALLESRLK